MNCSTAGVDAELSDLLGHCEGVKEERMRFFNGE